MLAKDINFRRELDEVDFGWLKMDIRELTDSPSFPSILDVALLHGLLEKAGGQKDLYLSSIRTKNHIQEVVEVIWTNFAIGLTC